MSGPLAIVAVLMGFACLPTARVPAQGVRAAPFTIIATYPHDSTAYTQGLLWADGALLESTGRLRDSELRRVDPTSGRVLARRALPDERFGEGLALLGGRLYQLTWQGEVAYVYDAKSFTLLDSIAYEGEGWGLASDSFGERLFMSDGSDSITVRSSDGLRVERVFHVRHRGEPVTFLNELEYVDGELLANVHRTNHVARIDPTTGEVLEMLDFDALYPEDVRWRGALTMNGIAVMPGGDLLLTGKLWPVMFRVRR